MYLRTSRCVTQKQGTEGRDSKLVDIRIGQQQEQEAAFRGQDGKAILEVFSEQKNAFEVEGEDTNGMTTAKETFRGGAPSNLYFFGEGVCEGSRTLSERGNMQSVSLTRKKQQKK